MKNVGNKISITISRKLITFTDKKHVHISFTPLQLFEVDYVPTWNRIQRFRHGNFRLMEKIHMERTLQRTNHLKTSKTRPSLKTTFNLWLHLVNSVLILLLPPLLTFQNIRRIFRKCFTPMASLISKRYLQKRNSSFPKMDTSLRYVHMKRYMLKLDY